ncbi:Metallo-hydrolase/oxidoreductase [Gloeophyllum trabeum ATCC 11539]|uniref:Metallo-hydrolase/oxidoreductase n=1 Tax=Gloeophyllum trabeum (strain ATCC 11539 / FP-39264 / Madison 617) TaxID=670483 RepID=S7RNW2_GLOTA|nr:Metallo-hydrolase/oxidoreductase [Gloeophyllum trabeum ATCC 11539]EPQ56220.1 Metallo-hydrolase/oxidoreductase [Gloeophyllum trabeum ATCC 11539]
MTTSLSIPPSNATVDVKILNAGNLHLAASLFMRPVVPGHENFVIPIYAFLVEHPAKDKKVLFDLGVRKRLEELSPATSRVLEALRCTADVEKDVATQLTEGGVNLASVNAIIWSHTHYDHTGDTSTFPGTTELIVGPGTKAHVLPPYPENPNGSLLASDLEGRKVTELTSEDFTLTLGNFRAHDYFGDGSFYLVNTPGHCPGHITALARTTPTTFILLGGDTCHHPGQFRPNAAIQRHIPCPSTLLSNLSAMHFPKHTPEALTLDSDPEPFLAIAAEPPTVYDDPPTARQSIKNLGMFDGSPDVLILLAHDASIQHLLNFFPQKANDWKERGWKEGEQNVPTFMSMLAMGA